MLRSETDDLAAQFRIFEATPVDMEEVRVILVGEPRGACRIVVLTARHHGDVPALHDPWPSCCRRCETIQNMATKRTSGSQPSTSVAEYGWVASPVKAGLRPPPPAADGLDRACHPAFVCHQAFDGKERLKPTQMPCQFFRVAMFCMDIDRHSHQFANPPEKAREIMFMFVGNFLADFAYLLLDRAPTLNTQIFQF